MPRQPSYGVEFEVQTQQRKTIRRLVLDWAKDNLREFPWRRNRDPYKILVAEMLLKRTTATAVSRIYEKIIGKYPSLEKLAQADEKDLEEVPS